MGRFHCPITAHGALMLADYKDRQVPGAFSICIWLLLTLIKSWLQLLLWLLKQVRFGWAGKCIIKTKRKYEP